MGKVVGTTGTEAGAELGRSEGGPPVAQRDSAKQQGACGRGCVSDDSDDSDRRQWSAPYIGFDRNGTGVSGVCGDHSPRPLWCNERDGVVVPALLFIMMSGGRSARASYGAVRGTRFASL